MTEFMMYTGNLNLDINLLQTPEALFTLDAKISSVKRTKGEINRTAISSDVIIGFSMYS